MAKIIWSKLDMTKKIFLIMPVYKTKSEVMDVIRNINFSIIHKLVLIDDACPQKTGQYVKNQILKEFFFLENFEFIFNEINLGVGGATKKGFKYAIDNQADLVIKIDSDGQMNPDDIPRFLLKQNENNFEFVKGNRFKFSGDSKSMPTIRFIGNILLGYITKINSGYKTISDPVNGYFLIKIDTLKKINYEKLNDGFFFESDILNNLGLIKASVSEVPIKAKYGNIKSNLNIFYVIIPFLYYHFLFFIKKKLKLNKWQKN